MQNDHWSLEGKKCVNVTSYIQMQENGCGPRATDLAKSYIDREGFKIEYISKKT